MFSHLATMLTSKSGHGIVVPPFALAQKKTGHFTAIGQVHGYEVVIREGIPEMGIAAKRRKENEVPLRMSIGLAAHLGLTVTIASSLRPGALGRAQRHTHVGYNCALTS